MTQLALVYQATEPPITHTVTRKATSYKLSALGKQRILALILACISIVIPVLDHNPLLLFTLSPLALYLLFSKQLHMTFNKENKKVGNK